MTPQEQMRKLIDNLHKQPSIATGGDKRSTAEAINTSAIARNQAMDRTKLGKVAKTVSLRELQSKR